MPEQTRYPYHNLPLQLSSFVGRAREMVEVEGLLADNHLLTLTGSGGSGKTRLALAVASEVARDFEDGVWLVELAWLSDPDLVPQAVASVLGIKETPGTPLVDSLLAHFASRKTLLVLDNCEHLVDACADLAGTLLRSCPNLRILATSRVVLGVPGETLFSVTPLSLPDPHHLPALGDRSGDEASELFLERARAVKPGFAITEQNAMAVAQVCYRLDGIPLAIELAAARTKLLSVGQISSRLDDSFALLTSRGRTALAHHRTLRATMDWSHDLLDEEEKVMFRRLTVFAGGWSLETAEAVCAGEGIPEWEILDLLTSLVDKSLVMVDEQEGEVRYRLLETIRQYGREKLEDSGEAEEVRSRHAAWFAAVAEEAEPHLTGHRQAAWLGRLETEHDNMRAALSWALERGKARLGLRLGRALGEFWYLRGYLDEGRRWLEAVLAMGEAPEAARAKPLARAAWIAWEQGDYGRSVALSEEGLALARTVEDDFAIGLSLRMGALACSGLGDDEVANALCEEGLRRSLRQGVLHQTAYHLHVAAVLAGAQAASPTPRSP